MTFALAGNTITQSGTDTDLSGISGNGATLTAIGALDIYDCGVNKLEITGTLTINGDDTGDREILLVGNGGGDADTDVRVLSGGTLNIGSRSVQGSTEFSQTAFFPSIFEKDNLTFGTSNAKATSGETDLGPAANKPFLVVDTGATLNWFGNVNCSGGIGFDGVGNDITTPATDATVLIEGGVWDARRTIERGGVGDQFLYQYSGSLTVDGFTVLSDEAAGIGATVILVEPPLQFKGYRPVMTEAALSGSTTVPLDFVVEIEDYPGIIGEGNTDGIMVASQAQQTNSAVVTFLNSAIGSLLTLVATQTFAVSQVMARQNVRATAVNPTGTAYTDAVVATEDRLSAVFEGRSEAVAAQATFTVATQPSDGDQFTIDAKQYTLQSTLTNVDGNIAIGGSLAATQTRIEEAINLTGVAGTDYATLMTIHPTVSCGTFASNDAILTAKTAGDAGNAIALLRSFAAITNVFDYNRMGVTRPGSDLADLNLGRLLMSEWNPDGGTTNPPILTTYNPSNTTDDLWSFYLYSYSGVDRSRIDVLMRGAGGTVLDFITPADLGVTEATRATVDAYATISDLARLYDRSKSHKVDNVSDPAIETPMVAAAGNAVDLGALNLILDGDAASAYAFAAGTLTINPVTGPNVTRIGATEAIIEAPEDDEITVSFPAGIADDDVAYLIIGHAESEDNAWNTPSGWTVITAELQTGGTPASVPGLTVFRRVLASDSGSVTVTNAGTNVSGIVGQMVVYRDVDQTTQEDVTTTTASAASGDPDPPSITPVNDGSMILAIALGDTEQTVTTPPSGYNSINDTVTVDGGTEGDRTGSLTQQEFSTAGTDTFVVPAGVTSIDIKVWGAGGGGGGEGSTGAGEPGGGGGFAFYETITVTPLETLDIIVGGGGGAGVGTLSGGGGAGGGRTEVARGATVLASAGAGGGGGGGDNQAQAGGTGGAGGGSTGEAGGDVASASNSLGGGGGTQIAGGAAGAGGDNNDSTAGAVDVGGDGGNTASPDQAGGAGGSGGGGDGGDGDDNAFGGGAGGGGGFFGGGGGADATSGNGGGAGGGGGSNLASGSTTNTQGSGTTGAGQGDSDYPGSVGDGGAEEVAGERGHVWLEFTPNGTSLDGCTLATAEFKQITAAAENPGTFDFNESEEWATATIAIRPDQAAGGDSNLSVTSKFTTINTSGTVTVRDGAGINGLTINADVILDDVRDLTDVTINGDLTIGAAGTYAFSNVTVTGDITNTDGAGLVTINASAGSVLSTSEPGTANGEVDIVNTVTLRVTCRDAATNAVIEDAQVWLEAGATGPLADGTLILDLVTNASGVAENTAFNYTADQLLDNSKARKHAASPLYKEGIISGSITSGGFEATVFMVRDE